MTVNVMSEPAIDAAIRKVEQMLDAAKNANQHGENAIVAAANGLDLLEALKRLCDAGEHIPVRGVPELFWDARNEARDIIARAEGRS